VGDIHLKTGLTVKETRDIAKPTLIGSIIGTAVGIFPGLGSATSSWFFYTTAQKLSKKPDQFGTGNPEGIAAAESANNACVGGALLPLLTLGVPGSPAVAIIMGAFIIHGIQPGPGVFSSNADLVYGIFYGFILTTIALYLIGKLVTPFFIRLVTFPNTFLVPCIMIFTLIGLYAIQSSVLDIIIALIFGIVIFLLAKFDFSPSAFILAFVLSGIIEKNFRRALVLSNGSLLIFVQRTGSAILLGVLLLIVVVSIRKGIKNKKTVTL
jgi:putative tricarboxylic transport membrane protein